MRYWDWSLGMLMESFLCFRSINVLLTIPIWVLVTRMQVNFIKRTSFKNLAWEPLNFVEQKSYQKTTRFEIGLMRTYCSEAVGWFPLHPNTCTVFALSLMMTMSPRTGPIPLPKHNGYYLLGHIILLWKLEVHTVVTRPVLVMQPLLQNCAKVLQTLKNNNYNATTNSLQCVYMLFHRK